MLVGYSSSSEEEEEDGEENGSEAAAKKTGRRSRSCSRKSVEGDQSGDDFPTTKKIKVEDAIPKTRCVCFIYKSQISFLTSLLNFTLSVFNK